MTAQTTLVLASGSPRRRELLEGLGLRFTIRAADVDETPHPGEEPAAYVLRLAEEKARATVRPGELALAALGGPHAPRIKVGVEPQSEPLCSSSPPLDFAPRCEYDSGEML